MKKQVLLGFGLLVLAVFGYFIYQALNRDELFKVMRVPEFELTNQQNELISNQDLIGKVYVVEFFFTNCPTICPVMNQNLIEVEKEINSPDFGLISITIDPKRDTPSTLKEHAEKLKIDNPNWHFLTGDRAYILDLSKKFNIYVGEDEESAEGLNHSGKIALIDKEGNVRSRYDDRGMPILYYSGLNYKDTEGKEMSLGGTYHPAINYLEEDIRKLLSE